MATWETMGPNARLGALLQSMGQLNDGGRDVKDFKKATGFDLDGNIRYSDKSDNDGLFPLPRGDGKFVAEVVTCRHPEHNPPSHLHIPEGHGYRHTCPGCGRAQVIKNEGPTFRG